MQSTADKRNWLKWMLDERNNGDQPWSAAHSYNVNEFSVNRPELVFMRKPGFNQKLPFALWCMEHKMSDKRVK